MKTIRLSSCPSWKVMQDISQEFSALRDLCCRRLSEPTQSDESVELLKLSDKNPMLVSLICGEVPRCEADAKGALLSGGTFFEDCKRLPKLTVFLQNLYKASQHSYYGNLETLSRCQSIWRSKKNRWKRIQLYGQSAANFELDIFYFVSSGVRSASASRWLSARYLVLEVVSRRRYKSVLTQCRKNCRRIFKGQRKFESGLHVAKRNECILEILCRTIEACPDKRVSPQDIALAILTVSVVCSGLKLWNGTLSFESLFSSIEKFVAGKVSGAYMR
ncbi:MAG TPA: hypothetical protein DD376_03055 [Sutterella sp.]|nr:hypothetical protein [Sutterella sp.]